MSNVKSKVEAAHIALHKRAAELTKGKPEADKKVYQPTYDDFFEWCSLDRDYPKLFFKEYAELHNRFEASNSGIIKSALGSAMHECWVSWFDKTKKYLTDVVGTKKPERNDSPFFGCVMFKPGGYVDFVRRMAARNAAKKEGGAK